MKKQKLLHLRRGIIPTVALGLVSFARIATAESVLSPTSFDSPRNKSLLDALLQWGPVTVRPHAGYSFVYGTDIQSAPGRGESTIIQTISPGATFTLGDQWTLEYSTGLSFYSNKEFDDSLSHNVSLNGHFSYDDWVFGVSHSVGISSNPLTETGQQTDQQSHSTSLSAGYAINSKLSLSLSASQNLNFVDGFNNSRSWGTSESINYHVLPRVSLGIALGANYTDVQLGSDIISESLSGTLGWQVADKTAASFTVGGTTTQFLDSDAKSLINPTFGISISYALWEPTTISLSANRGISSSYFANQVTESTSVSLGISQRFFGRYTVSFSGGYSTSDYISSETGESAHRTDEGYNFGVSFGRSIFARGTLSVFYSYNANSSSQSNYQYGSTQTGFSLGYSF